MGYKELININDELFSQSGIEKLSLNREPFIQKLVNDFISFYEKKYEVRISTIADISITLSYFYFSMCYAHIKPVIDDKTNRFKMASLMELIIVKEQVLIHPSFNEEKNRELNSLFGMTAAFSLIDCMICDAKQDFIFNTDNKGVNDSIQKILDDHKLWLTTKHLDDLPIFINLQFFELIEMIHVIPLQINGF